MKVKWTVEYKNNSTGEMDYIDEIEFEGLPRWENDSFDYAGTYCTGGVGGTCVLNSYTTMDNSEEATWDKTKHTPEENAIIDTWLKEDKNREEIDELLCNSFEKDQSGY